MWLLLLVSILLFLVFMSRREGYDICKGHCLRNSSGQVEDAWDCCQCMATVYAKYNKGFRKCMCNLGYGDFCFKPVTNLLLSQ
jgi:hypothetical protein